MHLRFSSSASSSPLRLLSPFHLPHRHFSRTEHAHSAHTTNGTSTAPRIETIDPNQTITNGIATISIIAKAGTRAEQKGEKGYSVALAETFFKATKRRSALRIVREAEIRGHLISTKVDRETLTFTVECPKNDIAYAADILQDAYTAATTEDTSNSDGIYSEEYLRRNHELANVHQYMKESSKSVNPAFDALHRVAFRNGLGNPLISSAPDPISLSSLRRFATQNMSGSNIAIIGTGVSNAELNSLFSDSMKGGAASTHPEKSKYYGGESRIAGNENMYLLAFPGAPIGSSKHTILEVIKAYLGGDIRMKWGAGLSPLVPSGSVFNIGYSDTGLFGINVHGDIEAIVKRGIQSLQKLASGKADQEEIARAKTQAKFTNAVSLEKPTSAVNMIGTQLLLTGKNVNKQTLSESFDKIQASDIAKVAKELLDAKASVSAVGDIYKLPYADQFIS